MSSVRILPVEGRRLRARFLDLPRGLYSGDPAWVEPLRVERSQHISPRNPFFEHATGALFLAQRGDRVVGRISAQIDRLHIEQHGEQEGFFGMLEAEDDGQVFEALFGAAEGWLRERGMRRALGPFNFSINHECGQLVEGFDTPPQIMMPHGHPYTPGRIEACGYAKAKDLLAFRMKPGTEWNRRAAGEDQNGLSLRPLAKAHMERELRIMREVFNESWEENWGFVPFQEKELNELGSLLKHVVPADYVWFAELEGETVGFLVVLPNLNESIADLGGRLLPFGWAKLAWRMKFATPGTARMVLLGLSRKIQNKVVGARAIFRLIKSVEGPLIRRRVDEVEMSWILEENRPIRSVIKACKGTLYKRYRIYSRELA
jgi:hypothetical protein